jgi:hypothetical protein
LPAQQQLEQIEDEHITILWFNNNLSYASSRAPAESSCLTQCVLSQANATCNAAPPPVACCCVNNIACGRLIANLSIQ